MVVVINRFIILLSLSALSSCSWYCNRVPRVVKKTFNYEKIEGFSGVYLVQPSDTTYKPNFYVFFEDGTFVSEIYLTELKNYFGISSVQELLESNNDGVKYKLNRGLRWGYYYFQNESLILKRTEGKLYPCHPLPANYYEYEKIGNNFRCTFSKDIANLKESDRSYEDRLDRNPSIKHHQIEFVDSCNCKTSDTWLKYEEWFWKNEEDYLKWIQDSGGTKEKYH